MSTEIQHFIGGKFVPGKSGRTRTGLQPGDRRAAGHGAAGQCGRGRRGGGRSRRAAWPAWAMTTPLRRARILNRFLRLLEENQERIAATIMAEHGKVLSDALGELARGIEVVEFATGAPHLLKGEVTENVGTRVDSHSLRQPLGVVAGITPFNFPAMVPMWMFPVALACGNCFILKVSERVPSASLILAELLKEAGAARRRVPGRARRQGGGRRHPAPPGHRRGQLRRLDPDRQVHLRDRGPARRSAARRWAAPRTT